MGGGSSVLEGSRVILSHPALEAANKSIHAIMKENGSVTLEVAERELTKFETAERIICQHFPGSKVGQTILDEAVAELTSRGITPANTLFAQSVCPDEINHNVGDITTLFSEWMEEVFHMGGLAGLPFTGKTGFTAFSHHVPDGGNLFILFAPHIGISDSGRLGEYSRVGQEHDGAACGAAVGALKYCTTCAAAPSNESLGANHSDYQMQFLIHEIFKKKDEINAKTDHNEKNAALVYSVYDTVKTFLDEVVNVDFGIGHGQKGKLILLGGIQINMPTHMMDYFEPLVFEIRSKDEPTIDLMSVFGPRS